GVFRRSREGFGQLVRLRVLARQFAEAFRIGSRIGLGQQQADLMVAFQQLFEAALEVRVHAPCPSASNRRVAASSRTWSPCSAASRSRTLGVCSNFPVRVLAR